MNFSFYLHDEISQEQFEKTLLWFKSRYNLVSANELREHIYGGKPLKNACMLSVDDGWRSTYEVIFPVMKKYNVPFSIFLSPEVVENEINFWYYTYRFLNPEEIKDVIIQRGHFLPAVRQFAADMILKELPIEEIYDILKEIHQKHPEIVIPRGFMNAQEVMALHKSGLVEVGAHTIMHPILSNESKERAEAEIKDSVTRLSSLLNKEVRTLAYPNGIEGVDYGKREMKIAKDCGVVMAFSVDPDAITASCNPLSLPRWGSIDRLKFGRLGKYLPSRMDQAKIRSEIRKLKV